MKMPKPNRIYICELDQPELIADLQNFLYDPANCRGMDRLRRYTKPEKVIARCKTDFQRALALAHFTSTAWQHDGFNSGPKKFDALTILKLAKKGASFSCVQFATVFVQLCHAVGIPARALSVQTRSPSLGSSGHSHVTAEYFDCQLGKWVWIDPQIHAYATHKKKLLSFNELAELQNNGQNPKLHFSARTLQYLGGDRARLKDLKNFLRRYIWISRVAGLKAFYTNQSSKINIGCKRRGTIPAITFQGFADKMPVYLPKVVFDAPLNACQMQIETIAPKTLIKWKDSNDYKKNAHKNFAKDQIRVHLRHSMPWFSHYLVLHNGRRGKVNAGSLLLKLKNGLNEIKIIPMNSFGREGIPALVSVRFDNKYKKVSNYW